MSQTSHAAIDNTFYRTKTHFTNAIHPYEPSMINLGIELRQLNMELCAVGLVQTAHCDPLNTRFAGRDIRPLMCCVKLALTGDVRRGLKIAIIILMKYQCRV
jgi:hypothetical protein